MGLRMPPQVVLRDLLVHNRVKTFNDLKPRFYR
jgi:hypothetical protein